MTCVAPNFFADIKYCVRRSSLQNVRALAAETLAQSTIEGVKRLLSSIRDQLQPG